MYTEEDEDKDTEPESMKWNVIIAIISIGFMLTLVGLLYRHFSPKMQMYPQPPYANLAPVEIPYSQPPYANLAPVEIPYSQPPYANLAPADLSYPQPVGNSFAQTTFRSSFPGQPTFISARR
jgi:hypothetical protein